MAKPKGKHHNYNALRMTLEITASDIMGLLCCASDGSMTRQWATVEGYSFPGGITMDDFREGGKYTIPGTYWNPFQLIPLVKGCYVQIKDDETDKVHKLDRKAIMKGLQAMAKEAPHHFGDFIADRTDAITGDVFVQCCLFGKVLYG